MNLIKSNRRQASGPGESLMTQDPFFRSLFNLNRVFNGDFDDELNLVPGVNIKENDKQYQVEVAAPGFNKEDFDITVDNGILTISAEKEQKEEKEKEGFVRREFGYKSFSRSMSLPDSVDEEKEINARYKDGILDLTVPKKEEAKSKPAKKVKIS